MKPKPRTTTPTQKRPKLSAKAAYDLSVKLSLGSMKGSAGLAEKYFS